MTAFWPIFPIFPKISIFDPPGNTQKWPFFWAFFRWPKSRRENDGFLADFQKTPKKGFLRGSRTRTTPGGFGPKIAIFGQNRGFWDPQMTTFWPPFGPTLGPSLNLRPSYHGVSHKKWQKGSKSWSKKWPHKICHFLGYPKKSDTPKMTKMAKNPFFDHFLTTFWPPSGSLWIPLVIFKESPIWVSQKSDKKGPKVGPKSGQIPQKWRHPKIQGGPKIDKNDQKTTKKNR